MKTTTARRIAIAASMLISITAASPAIANATPQEDDPGWSCVDDGNRICGPNNPQGAPAGCYDDGGVLVAAWPCHLVVDPQTGDADVYTGLVDANGQPVECRDICLGA